MKLKPRESIETPHYPSVSLVRTLLVGTTITAALALSGCGKKEKEQESSPGSKPAVKPAVKSDKIPLEGKIKPVQMPKDTDADGIPDDQDKCPTSKGEKANMGCPGKVPPPPMLGKMRVANPPGDVVTPPAIGGKTPPVSDMKLKDSDGDGIPDAKDRCPTRKGHISNRGCPRRLGGRPSVPHKPRVNNPMQGTEDL
ncbi:thrombospondin type 3 repeat-containing protein [Myxococcota bacterium]|nr:thrombospondin type 3 repeat-containing protein [Myxococcota bacterium]MBU1537769.1 thrombospondin type 3 repeat-containing protein [Myxococcota bacterium]